MTKNKKKLLLFLLLMALFLLAFLLYPVFYYNTKEEFAKKEITDMCLSSSIAKILNTYFESNQRYPDEEKVVDFILSSGYPSKLGCGPTSFEVNSEILNSFGDRFVYKRKSLQSATFYFSKENNEIVMYYLDSGSLINGASL